MRITPKHADAAHCAGAHSQRSRQHGSESAAPGQVRVAHTSIRLQVGGLHGPALLDGHACDPLTNLDADLGRHVLRKVQAGQGDELAGDVIHPHNAAGLHAEHAARLLHDDLHCAADVQAGRHRPAGLQQGARLPSPPLALLEELSVVDGDAGLLAERFQHALVVGGEDTGSRGEG